MGLVLSCFFFFKLNVTSLHQLFNKNYLLLYGTIPRTKMHKDCFLSLSYFLFDANSDSVRLIALVTHKCLLFLFCYLFFPFQSNVEKLDVAANVSKVF